MLHLLGYTLPPGIYEIKHINFILKSLLPVEVIVYSTNDDIRLPSNLTTNSTIRFTTELFPRNFRFSPIALKIFG